MSDSPQLPTPPPPPAPPQSSALRNIFFNSAELRAGWRLLIFIAFLAAFIGFLTLLSRLSPRAGGRAPRTGQLTPAFGIIGEGSFFLLVLLVTAIMGAIERRRVGFYGLPLRQAFRGRFWLGVLWGFLALTVLVGSLRAAGVLHFAAPTLHGAAIWKYALAWAAAFLFVGFQEEYLLRGYAQFTLTTGIGFWPAAVLLSLVFAGFHIGNSGEDPAGLASVILAGLFFCFTLRRTGSLWFAVGFHAAWDWGESYFYGTPNSGLLARGHLLNSSYSGPALLSGGTAGPEGSILIVPLMVLLFILFHLCFRKPAPYPDPAALKLPKPRPLQEELAA